MNPETKPKPKPIQLVGLSKSYGNQAVLTQIAFEVHRGEMVGFVGPNGAGKTTCLRILTGLTRRDAGTARVMGMDPAREPVKVRRSCSYLPGETSIYHGMTGGGFLRFALSYYPQQHEGLRQELEEVFGLPLADKVRSYSAGMKQKLALMASLIPDVDLYILDEPDRALDATVRFYLRELLQRLRQKGRTILLSSHHLREVEALADRLLFLMDGHVLPEGQVAAARARLEKQIHLRLRPGTPPPEGAREIARDPDGLLRLEVESEPLEWLCRIDRTGVLSAEVGTVRLEELYRLLTEEDGREGRGSRGGSKQ